MGLEFTFQVPGDALPQIAARFDRMVEGVSDLRPAFRQIIDDLEETSRKQFGTEGRHGSGGWAPLSPDYATRKEEEFGFRPILVATGTLRDALTRRGRGALRVVKRQEMRFGVDDRAIPYAKYHQSGTRGHFEQTRRFEGVSGHPRRRPIELTKRERIVMLTRIRRHAWGLSQDALRASEALG